MSGIKQWMRGVIPRHISNESVLFFLQLLSFRVAKKKRGRNLANNQSVLEAAEAAEHSFFHRNEYIENQNEWERVKFGSHSMKFSGCEIMATYNALLSLGVKMTGAEVAGLIGQYEKKGAVLSGGFGVAPKAICRYFRSIGYPATMVTQKDPEVLDALGRAFDTAIITVYNNQDNIMEEIHTMNVSKDASGQFFLHNGYKVNKKEDGTKTYVQAGPFQDLGTVLRHVANGNAALVCAIGINRKNTIG